MKTSVRNWLVVGFSLLLFVNLGCGSEQPADTDGPCPCDGASYCGQEGGSDVCITPIGESCDGTDYVCDHNLTCHNGTCIGDEGYSCVQDNDCLSPLSCLDGVCDSPCPCDGSSECDQEDGVDVCVSPLDGSCDEEGYQCGEDLTCENDTCVGDLGYECEESDECKDDLECIGGTCGDSPCPCGNDAECSEDDDGNEICVVEVGGECDEEFRQCDDGLTCEDETCVGIEWSECDSDDQCMDGLDCIGDYCTNDQCDQATCPADGDSDTVSQDFCDIDGDSCVQCRYWADEAAGSGAGDCPGDQVCTVQGYCADPIRVPREEPFNESMAEAEAVAIATAICSLEGDEHKSGAGGTTNFMCGTIVMDDDTSRLEQSDIQGPAEAEDFDYLSNEGTIDGWPADDVAEEIKVVWDESWLGIDRMRWFSEGDMSWIPGESRYEIVMWVGSRASYAWALGIDTIDGYFERGHIDDWNEDGAN